MNKDSYDILKSTLLNKKIKSWFELGLFLDHIRDNRKPMTNLPKNYHDFLNSLKNGVAFITYDFGVDGVSIEIEKYRHVLKSLIKKHSLKDPKIYYIGSSFNIEFDNDKNLQVYTLDESCGFDSWDGYHEYFFTKLGRGSNDYNLLFTKVWEQTLSISLKLGKFIFENDIQLLFPVNTNSNPGNIPLAFSLVLISEIMKIPVLNSNHDFYWESGEPPSKSNINKTPGIRDHFFTNYHIGEIFTLIEMLYPWDSPFWYQCTINQVQVNTLIDKFGFNPINVTQIPTYIDSDRYCPKSPKSKKNILERLHILFSGSTKKIYSKSISEILTKIENPTNHFSPFIIGNKSRINIHFDHSNMLILQPTRIIKRKRIERIFTFFNTLLENSWFVHFLKSHPQLTITILITGPLANGQYDYYKKIMYLFRDFLDNINDKLKNRFFLGFKFGLETNEYMKKNHIPNLAINELFGTATLVTLPSETEGRGLPIIESSSSGVPLLVNRYKPEHVFDNLIGKDLDESLRLKVFEIPKNTQDIPDGFFEIFTNHEIDIQRKEHNRSVVKKRFTFEILEKKFEKLLNILWIRCQHPNKKEFQIVKKVYDKHKAITQYNDLFYQLVLCKNRKYLPGFTNLEFMIILKSLIDPSFFRMEEKELKGRIMGFAKKILTKHENFEKVDFSDKITFYNELDTLFEYNIGVDDIVIDHSLSYRHRHNSHYFFRKITEFELIGLVAEIFRKNFGSIKSKNLSAMSFNLFMKSYHSLSELVGYKPLAINNSKRLIRDLQSNKSVAIFPGTHLQLELQILVLQTFRLRFGITNNEEITQKVIDNYDPKDCGTVYLFIREKSIGSPVYFKNVKSWLENSDDYELKLLYKYGFLKIVPINVIALGTHLGQLGEQGIKTLLKIKRDNGFLISLGETNYMMIDKIDIPSYRIGTVDHILFRNYSQIRRSEAYIQWVPGGLSPGLAYPTPIQSPVQFSKLLNGKLYKKCCSVLGEENVIKKLHEDADNFNSPVQTVLQSIVSTESYANLDYSSEIIISKMLTGIHDDGLPWSGAQINVKSNLAEKYKSTIQFHTMFSSKINDTVLDLVNKFEKQSNKKVHFAWNGGYMLNPELVGKLGLPEEYIGSPLGLAIIDGEIQSLPLYNKPSLCIYNNNKLDIRDSNLKDGLTISIKSGGSLTFSDKHRNIENPIDSVFYDLLYPNKQIIGKNRIIYRFAGSKIIDIIKNETLVEIIPVGITVSVPDNIILDKWNIGSHVEYYMKEWANVKHAIEAGPMLVQNGKIAIDMVSEGWKTEFSIATQAARVDYTHLRGPKIGVGLLNSGELIIVAINGRIRESVGATHIELAKTLIEQGAETGMGFDPGGSVTLLHNGKQLNISPYNINYEDSPYSLPPQARRIGNAILGTIESLK